VLLAALAELGWAAERRRKVLADRRKQHAAGNAVCYTVSAVLGHRQHTPGTVALVVHGLLAAPVDPAVIGKNTISLLLGNVLRYGATAFSQNNHASL